MMDEDSIENKWGYNHNRFTLVVLATSVSKRHSFLELKTKNSIPEYMVGGSSQQHTVCHPSPPRALVHY